MKEYNKTHPEIDNLYFIFGMPRSGTTLLWSILEEHPDIEPFTLFEKNEYNVYPTSESGVFVTLQKDIQELVELCKEAKEEGKIVIEKTPIHTVYNKEIKQIFPNSDCILLVRNPVEIYNSLNNIFPSNKHLWPKGLDMNLKDVEMYFKQYENIVEEWGKDCYITYYSNILKQDCINEITSDFLSLKDIITVDPDRDYTSKVARSKWNTGVRTKPQEISNERLNELKGIEDRWKDYLRNK